MQLASLREPLTVESVNAETKVVQVGLFTPESAESEMLRGKIHLFLISSQTQQYHLLLFILPLPPKDYVQDQIAICHHVF
jgi:hypothetical protein